MLTYILKKTLFRFTQTKPMLYIFAGQGTQEKGMLDELLQISEAKQEIVTYSEELGIDFIEINSTDKDKVINKTRVTQPLLVLSQVLRYKYLHKIRVHDHDLMLGHSVGEYSALCVAGSIGLQNCLKLVQKRGQLMEECTKEPSGMLIVRFSINSVTQVMKKSPMFTGLRVKQNFKSFVSTLLTMSTLQVHYPSSTSLGTSSSWLR